MRIGPPLKDRPASDKDTPKPEAEVSPPPVSARPGEYSRPVVTTLPTESDEDDYYDVDAPTADTLDDNASLVPSLEPFAPSGHFSRPEPSPTEPDNMFAAPSTDTPPPLDVAVRNAPAASLERRLRARLIDTLVPVMFALPGFFFALLFTQYTTLVWAGLLFALGCWGALSAWNYWRLAIDGTSMGKRYEGIRLLSEDDEPLSFFAAVVVREWLVLAVDLVTISVVFLPVGSVVDGLFAVLGDGRTLRDRLTGTRVVLIRPQLPSLAADPGAWLDDV